MNKKKFSSIISSSECLFRYRKVNEQSLSALKYNKLFFSTAQKFNDPYDNLVFADTQKILSDIFYNLNIGMDNYLSGLSDNNLLAANLGRFVWDESNRERTLRNHFDLICSCLDAIRLAIKRNVKIICLSEAYDSMLMWSHYADNHKGFMVTYQKDAIVKADRYSSKGECLNNNIRLEKISYVNTQVDLTNQIEDFIRYNMLENMGDVEKINASISAPLLRKVVTEKAQDWSYEREWRVIPRIPKIEEESPLCYMVCKPKAVIIGSKCNEDNVDAIRNICNEIQVPIFRMFLSETSPEFRLVVSENGDLISV